MNEYFSMYVYFLNQQQRIYKKVGCKTGIYRKYIESEEINFY